uniref:Solute carrier family 38 member 8 n=1 Tax=Cyclopterus lumpus TaxID=8103 RepID=A0A8C2WKG5_CYCLU
MSSTETVFEVVGLDACSSVAPPPFLPPQVSLVFLVSGLIILVCFVFNLFMISVAFLVIVDDQLEKCEWEGPISSWSSMFSVIPTICFGFQCHEASVTIYSCMENQRLSHWVFISVVSMIFCLVIYSLTGAYGYLTFGKDVKADILMSYTGDDILMLIARLLFGISIITIYPIILLLGRSVIQDPLLSWRRRRDGVVTAEFESRSRYVLTVLWVTVTLLIATYVPDISKVISVIGGISAFFIFIFPGLCLMFAMQSEPVSWRTRVVLTVWGAVTLLCGAFIFGQSTTTAVMQVLGKI